MRQFNGFGDFAAFLMSRAYALENGASAGLEKAGAIVEAEAKSEIGTYQDAAGPFEAWAPLSDATLNGGVSPEGHPYPGKIELGFSPPDNPLLRIGALRDAIAHTVERRTVTIGVPHATVTAADGRLADIGAVAIWQEQGTARMPPRSFLGGALFRKTDEAVDAVAGEIVRVLAGDSVE